MGLPSFVGWWAGRISVALREDRYAHAAPFGTHKGPHLVCTVGGSAWSVESEDVRKVFDRLTTP